MDGTTAVGALRGTVGLGGDFQGHASPAVQQRQRQPGNPARNPSQSSPVLGSLLRVLSALNDHANLQTSSAPELSSMRARSQAATVPVEDRLKSFEEVVRRSQKGLSQADVAVQAALEHRDRMQAEFEDGHRDRNPPGAGKKLWSWMEAAQLRSVLVRVSECPQRPAGSSGHAKSGARRALQSDR